MKFCDNTAPNAAGICRHTLDTVGCNVNVPAAYEDNVFLSCEGEDQDPVAIGDTRIPATSNCKTFASSELWSALPQPTGGAAAGGSSSSASSPFGAKPQEKPAEKPSLTFGAFGQQSTATSSPFGGGFGSSASQPAQAPSA